MFSFFKRKNKDISESNNSEVSLDTDVEPIEVFTNSSENKRGELYYKNGYYTYKIIEKLSDNYEGEIYYYWCPILTTASFFDTKDKAIKEILSIINEE